MRIPAAVMRRAASGQQFDDDKLPMTRSLSVFDTVMFDTAAFMESTRMQLILPLFPIANRLMEIYRMSKKISRSEYP